MTLKEQSGFDESLSDIALIVPLGILALTHAVDSWAAVRESPPFFWAFLLMVLGIIACHAVTSDVSRPWMVVVRNVLLLAGFVMFVTAAGVAALN